VRKGLHSVYADYRFNEYEKKGFLAECLRQRERRLRGIPDDEA
jgi:hypothetical protein